jgi:hypothetical protein
MYRYWWESQKGKDHYEDLDAGGWIILKRDHRQDWINLAKDKDQWRALVIQVMGIRVP